MKNEGDTLILCRTQLNRKLLEKGQFLCFCHFTTYILEADCFLFEAGRIVSQIIF